MSHWINVAAWKVRYHKFLYQISDCDANMDRSKISDSWRWSVNILINLSILVICGIIELYIRGGFTLSYMLHFWAVFLYPFFFKHDCRLLSNSCVSLWSFGLCVSFHAVNITGPNMLVSCGDYQPFALITSEEKIKLELKRYVIDKLQLLFTAEWVIAWCKNLKKWPAAKNCLLHQVNI